MFTFSELSTLPSLSCLTPKTTLLGRHPYSSLIDGNLRLREVRYLAWVDIANKRKT